MAKDHKRIRSSKKQGYYKNQFLRTSANKARRAAKRLRRKLNTQTK